MAAQFITHYFLAQSNDHSPASSFRKAECTSVTVEPSALCIEIPEFEVTPLETEITWLT